VVNDEQLALLRILVDRRRALGEDHTRMVGRNNPARGAGALPVRASVGPLARRADRAHPLRDEPANVAQYQRPDGASGPLRLHRRNDV